MILKWRPAGRSAACWGKWMMMAAGLEEDGLDEHRQQSSASLMMHRLCSMKESFFLECVSQLTNWRPRTNLESCSWLTAQRQRAMEWILTQSFQSSTAGQQCSQPRKYLAAWLAKAELPSKAGKRNGSHRSYSASRVFQISAFRNGHQIRSSPSWNRIFSHCCI